LTYKSIIYMYLTPLLQNNFSGSFYEEALRSKKMNKKMIFMFNKLR
jgi:hypothetical protein